MEEGVEDFDAWRRGWVDDVRLEVGDSWMKENVLGSRMAGTSIVVSDNFRIASIAVDLVRLGSKYRVWSFEPTTVSLRNFWNYRAIETVAWERGE